MSAFNPDPPIIVEPCFKVVVYGILYGQQTVNTFYYARQTTTANVASPAEIATLFLASCQTSWESAVSEDWVGQQGRCYRLDEPSMPPHIETTAAFAGTIVEDATPATVSARLRRRTAHGGAKGRGMVRLAGLPRTSIDNGVIDAAELLLLEALATDWLDVLAPVDPTKGTYAPYLIKRAGLPGPPPLVVNRGSQVISWSITNILGHQNTRQAHSGGE